MDKIEAYERYNFNIMFVGDDWFNTKKWNEIEKKTTKGECENYIFSYTKSTSSSLINNTLKELRK